MSSAEDLAFKYLFCDVLNDPDYRARLSGLRDLAFVEFLPRRQVWARGSVQSRRGTIYVKFGDEAHYVAYRRESDDSLLIYDSSHPNGTFSGSFDGMMDLVKRVFAVTNVEFDDSYGDAVQRGPGDTFCQTWSLAYFTPFRDFLSDDRSPRFKMNDIIKGFCRKKVFQNILKDDWEKIYRWQVMSIDEGLVDLREPCFQSYRDVLQYANDVLNPIILGRIMVAAR